MKRDLLLRVLLPAFIYGAIGWWFGSKIVAIQNVQTFKILNIIGLTFDLGGILVLSHFVASSVRIQRFIANEFIENFVAFLISAIVGAIAYSFHGKPGPSTEALKDMAMAGTIVLVGPVINTILTFIVGIDSRMPYTDETKCKLFGFSLLAFGLLIQLYAAVLDLYS